MNYFFSKEIIDDKIILSNKEMIHCVKVLRHKVEDRIKVVDGKGNLYEVEISSITSDKCETKIINTKTIKNKVKVHLIICPTKNHKRIEWMLEKIVEIGVDRVSFIISKNTIRKNINMERLNKIALSAMKQTQNAFLPEIDDCIKFKDVFSLISSKEKYIAHLNKKNNIHLNLSINNTNSRCIMIGPEGDFTDEEVEYSLKKGFKEVSLGISRLRTETSGIVSTTILNL
ncbi:MAG: hypothetical protein CBB66_03850 [bacterium TMED6]|nr:MAG: hypothetical protein CBB66_03850 [bacterium TMED6]